MRSKPRMLDGCCGAGGASRGYVNAGFEAWGTDIRVAEDYERSGGHWLGTADIRDVLRNVRHVHQYHFIHVSPPCQFYSQMSRCRPGLAQAYPDLIGPVRELLIAGGIPYVIENVAAARPWLRDPIVLCGQMFGRPVYRHRLFEAGNGITLTAPQFTGRVPRTGMGRPRTLNPQCGWPHPVPAAKAGHWKPGMYVSVSGHERKEPVRAAMGIDWMRDREDIKEAIPPYMTHEIGLQILEQLS